MEGFLDKKIDELEMLISQLPKFPKNEIEKLKGEETIVDTEILISYDANEKIDDLDELRRNKVSDINVIEGAISLLFGKYCFTAWFSLALALLLDMSSLLAGLFIFGIQKKKA